MGVRRSVTGILAGTLGCLALLLSACGGGDDSVADPPVSPATSSPTESAQHESVEQFIRRWAAEDAQMQNTGDTSDFRTMSRGCDGCDAVADRVDSIYEAGGSVHTGGWTVLRLTQSVQNGKTRTIELLVDSAPTTYTPSKGAAPNHLEGGREHFQIEVRPTGNSWVVVEFVEIGS